MKLYSSIGPNPKAVRVFLAEKGIAIPLEKVDLPAGENRRALIWRATPMARRQCSNSTTAAISARSP